MRIPKLIKEGNVAYEGFEGAELNRAKFAWNQASRAADLAVRAVQQFNLAPNAAAIKTWFGLNPQSNPRHAQRLMQVQSGVTKMAQTFKSNPVTLVYKPNIVVKHVPDDPSKPLEPAVLADGTPFIGENIYGFVHHHLAGSGYRVILGKWFIADPDQQEASQTVYHELTHKVLRTRDHCYGVQNCKNLAANTATRRQACTNADSWAYFAKSMIARV